MTTIAARGQAQLRDDPVEHLAAPAIPPVPVLGSVCLELVVPVHPGSIPYAAPARALRRKLTVRSHDSFAAGSL